MINITIQKIIFALLLSLKPYDGDAKVETTSERIERMSMLSTAITAAAEDSLCENNQSDDCWKGTQLELASLLLAKGWSETRFSRHIHENKCNPDECDAVYGTWFNKNTQKYIKYVTHFRARSHWQLHKWTKISSSEWAKMGSGINYDSTYTSALVAARILSFTCNRCGSISGGIALYATGKTCKWSGAANREYLYTKLLKTASNTQLIKDILSQQDVSLVATRF